MYVMSGFDLGILILLMKMIYVGKITLTPRSVGIFLDSLVSPESELALKYQNIGDLFSVGRSDAFWKHGRLCFFMEFSLEHRNIWKP